ncbi:MAG: ROK family protein [Candidatus Omnitrophota bacterium]|jgi:glucokinase
MSEKLIIAVDLGGTNLKIALLDAKYKIIDKQVLSTQRFVKKEKLIWAITEAVNEVIGNNGLDKRRVLGVGIGLPGPVDVKQGLVHFFPNIPGWKNVKLKSILEKRLNLPVFLDNDANLMCLAEYKLGAARGSDNAVCLTLGTGVGGGIIINTNLYRARSFAAGEIGHIPINERGPRCNCGGRGCLEAYLGSRRIKAQARRIFKRNISLEELSGLAKKGNKSALRLWSGIGRRLGRALAGVVNFLSPDCIVIGGGVANAGKILFSEVKKTILKQAMPVQARHVKIFKAKLADAAGLVGAAILVKEKTGL